MSGPTDAPHRILLIQTAFIGDVVLATSLIEALHARWPHTRIDVLVRQGCESLLYGHPYVYQVLIWKKHNAKYRRLWSLLHQVRSERYSLVCTLQRFAATGLLVAFSGAKWRVGFKANPLSAAFTHRSPHTIGSGSSLHEIERNYQLLRPWLPDSPAPRPRLYPSEEDFRQVRRTSPYVCIAPSSVWYTKQWPENNWVQLIAQLPEDQEILLLGGPEDRNICDRIALASHGRAKNLAGALTLLQSAALMAGARMNYVNDSAPLHLCSAMNAPVTAVFCSTLPQFGFGPLSEDSRIVETPEHLDCRPCGIHGHKACPQGHFRCADIPVAHVLGTVVHR